MIKRFEKFSYFISELSKLLHKIEAEELESLGLKGPYAIYILTIAKYENGIPAAKLSEVCARDKADVSRAISALIESGIAAKRSAENAKYKVPIILTDKGRLIANSISEKAKNAVEFASKGVSDEKRNTFYETLETIYSNLKKMSKNGVPLDSDND